MNYDLCSGTCLKKSGIYSVAMFQKISLAFRRGIFFPVAPGESKFIPNRGNPRWSTKKYPSPFGGGYFFWSLPGCRSLSPIGEIPAGAPKNLLAFWRGDFFWSLRGVEVYPRQGKSPLEHQKISLAFRRGNIFSGRSRGVEVYPQ